LNRQSFLTIDSAARPEKAQDVFCAVVDVPEDVRLSLKPAAGYAYYAQLFHQMGHAQFALFNNNKSLIFRQLYKSPVREAFSLFFEKIWEDSSWTNRFMNQDTAKAIGFYEYLAFDQLLKLRMAAAAIQFQIERGTFTNDTGEHFQQDMSRAMRVPLSYNEALWLHTQQDGFFDTAVYLQASILEAHLRNNLKDKFGQRWYNDPDCGKYLKSLWSRGNEWSIPEFMKEINLAELNPNLLMDNLRPLARPATP
ncbi:MAG: hypothetical protein CV087_11025, partial [Candidatus Brocadia sp. WS118]